MLAIEFRKSIPRYLALRAVGPHWSGVYTSALSPVALRELAEPKLPTPEWARVRPVLSGICGSDLATIGAKGSAYLSPLTSTPFVLGHEVIGRVTDVGSRAIGVQVGDRVVLQPALGCRVRGIDPPCDACGDGSLALCRNVTRGSISAGIQTGFCRDTGGAWSGSFVAHPSQLYAVPDTLDDESAVLAEPFACALHGVLRMFGEEGSGFKVQGQGKCGVLAATDARGVAQWSPAAHLSWPAESSRPGDSSRPGGRSYSTVLVMGCGSIGLLSIAALRAIAAPARIIAVAKYAHQREHAHALGADVVLSHSGEVAERYRTLAGALGAELHRPEIGKPTVVGGADVVFDCVASSASIDDCCRFTRAGGTMVLVGMPAIPSGIDWTSIWYKELSIHAAYAYGVEAWGGGRRSTFEIALELLSARAMQLRTLVGEPFPLREFRPAFRAAMHVGQSRSVKTVFRIGPA